MDTSDLVAIRVVLEKWREQLTRDDPWPYLSSAEPGSLTKGDANLFLLGLEFS